MDTPLLQQAVMEGSSDGQVTFDPMTSLPPMSLSLSPSSSNSLSDPNVQQTYNYDEIFPALPHIPLSEQANSRPLGQWNQKMRIGTSIITQVMSVPYEERKFDHSDKFGEGNSLKTCASIMQETKANIEISSSKDQSLTFVITGRQDAVQQARIKIAEQFQTQASSSISIPKEHHKFILGRQGKTLADLQLSTGTKISVPKSHENSDKIVITGLKEGIDKAIHEIQSISDQQSCKAHESMHILKVYHPFIAGANNCRVQQLMAENNVRVNIPPLSVMKDEISIAGEKEGVLRVKNFVLQAYEEMQSKYTVVQVEVSKLQHKYVIGPRGNTITEILAETGVSVEMPPSDSNSDTITLRGPPEKLGYALTKVYEKANSGIAKEIDAPQWLHKYIIGRNGTNIKLITQNYPKVHVEFGERIKLEGLAEEVELVKSAIEKVVLDYMQNLSYEEMPVDPRLHKHIIGKNGANVNRLKEETGVTIQIPDSSGNVIRIEGTHNGVERAKQELLDMIFKLENTKEKEIAIDQCFHKNIIGQKGEKIKEIRELFNQVQIIIPGIGDKKRDVVTIRGPKADVDQCYKHLQKLVKELIDKSYCVKVPIYKQFHKFIIGKGGANIRKIREETDTYIDLPAEGSESDVIQITGCKENVEEAKARILKIQNELSNIVQVDIMIPAKFHNSIIGAGGKLIQSIMEECGGVSIKFPPPESNSDKVTIRGPKDDVDRAKKTLLEMSNEKQQASYMQEVLAKWEHHRFLIGRNGANIKKIRDATGARIVFPSENDSNREVITIIGKKDAVDKAKVMLEDTIKELDKVTEIEIFVNPKHHMHFVARRGEILRQISNDFGGVMVSFPRTGVNSDKVVIKGIRDHVEGARQRILEIVHDLEQMVTIECIIAQKHHRTVMGSRGCKVQGITADYDVQIKFPDKETREEYSEDVQVNGDCNDNPKKSDIIRITGKPEQCEKAKQALLALVPISMEVNIPFEFHRYIIGRKGEHVRDMMDRYYVNIAVPPADQQSDVIKVTGPPSNVEEAKQALFEKMKEEQDRQLKSFVLEVKVSSEYHSNIIGRRGDVVSKLRKDHDVQIQFPKKGDEDQETIKIIGFEENANAARDAILKLVEEIMNRTVEEVSIDHRVHSRLIGNRGRNVTGIMKQYQVDIKFPRDPDGNPDLVTISGSEENVLDAKDHLLNLEAEYLQDIDDTEMLKSYTRAPSRTPNMNYFAPGNQGDAVGFVVTGGPWDQQQQQNHQHQQQQKHHSAPNTSSSEDFPSFGDSGSVSSPPIAWGPRR